MKLWKRFGAALLAALTLTAMLTGTALAEEPELVSAPGADVAVQMDGKPLTFTDAVPEITGGRTFLPFRAVLEAMGAEVGYDEATRTVSAQRGGVKLELVPGQTRLTITENGEARTVEMDVAPYTNESNGRTYIPVRYAAEAFGYNVGWDADGRTVIMADVDALFGDATFALMDSFAAYCDKQGASRNMSLTGKLTAEMTDKTGALTNKPVQISGSVDGVTGDKGLQLALQVNTSGLTELAANAGGTPLEQAMLQAMLKVLSNLSAEVRADLEKAIFYISLPVELTGAENTWYSLDLGAYQAKLLETIDMAQLTQLEDASVREALVWVMRNIPLDNKDVSYSALAEAAKLYVDMLSDQAFTQEGDAYVLKTTLEDIIDLKITLTKKGEDIVAMDLTMTASVEEEGGKMSVTMTEHAAPDKVDAVMDMTVESAEMGITVHMDLNCVPTDKAPETQPPAGAQVIPMDQLIPVE